MIEMCVFRSEIRYLKQMDINLYKLGQYVSTKRIIISFIESIQAKKKKNSSYANCEFVLWHPLNNRNSISIINFIVFSIVDFALV